MPRETRFRNRIELLQGTLDLLILQTLRWGPQHGYGISQAIQANSEDVVRLVVGQGMRSVLLGILIGVGGALALTRLIAHLLFGVSASDPLTLMVVTGLLTAVGLLACYLPARRATKVDPLVALRCE